MAKQHAEGEFAKYRVLDDVRFKSDFDRMVDSLPAPKDKKRKRRFEAQL